jgi:hypothetical protein
MQTSHSAFEEAMLMRHFLIDGSADVCQTTIFSFPTDLPGTSDVKVLEL